MSLAPEMMNIEHPRYAVGALSRRTRACAARRIPFTPLALCALVTLGLIADAQPVWHDRFPAAQAAARASGKLIFVYIYSDRLPNDLNMLRNTLRNAQVVAALRAYECCAIDATVPENAEFAKKYTVARSADPEAASEKISDSALVFMDADERVYYGGWAHVPVDEFLNIVARVPEIACLSAILDKTPDDPRANADLGHVLLEVGLIQPGRKRLDKAIAADPDNKAGAKADAQLDLIIVDIPRDPVRNYEALKNYLRMYPKTDRQLETLYYQAVALVAQGDDLAAREPPVRTWPLKYQSALTILEGFKTLRPPGQRDANLWIAAAEELREQIKKVLTPTPKPR